MKRDTKLSIACPLSLLFLLSVSCTMAPLPVSVMPDLSAKPDGTYIGFYDGGLVKARVSVAVVGGKISGAKILNHDSSPVGKKGEAVVVRAVEKQTLNVDVVSGATHSSMVLLKAMEIALSGNSGT